MTILVTGSNGITARRLTALLQPQHEVLIASRHTSTVNSDPPIVQFNWTDPHTFNNPFDHPQARKSPITALYIVAPTGEQAVLNGELAFVELAAESGVKRFVLLGSSLVPEGGPFMGQVHKKLRELGVEWAVLRPSWFMENFSEQQHLATIRDEGAIYTATGRGKVPFCSADDIAAVAFHALTATTPPNREYVIDGPELLNYDDVASILTETIGKPVKHENLSPEVLVQRFVKYGVPEPGAQGLASMDVAISKGAEERENDDVLQVTGRMPKSFRYFAEENRNVWL